MDEDYTVCTPTQVNTLTSSGRDNSPRMYI